MQPTKDMRNNIKAYKEVGQRKMHIILIFWIFVPVKTIYDKRENLKTICMRILTAHLKLILISKAQIHCENIIYNEHLLSV